MEGRKTNRKKVPAADVAGLDTSEKQFGKQMKRLKTTSDATLLDIRWRMEAWGPIRSGEPRLFVWSPKHPSEFNNHELISAPLPSGGGILFPDIEQRGKSFNQNPPRSANLLTYSTRAVPSLCRNWLKKKKTLKSGSKRLWGRFR